MDLLEYQAKKLFRQVGIPVLPSETIAEPRELKQLQIPYPIVLKSQVKVGGRGKAGGIKFVTNTIDAIAAARTIFNLSILGEYPEVILAEARYNAQQELFLGIVIDYQLQCPVIFGSIAGGMNIDLLLENLQQVVIEKEFSSFLARRLAVQMGLAGDLLLEVSAIIEKMYELFMRQDLELIEINPLAIDQAGNLMALDGKVTISDRALTRHPELINLSQIEAKSSQEAIKYTQITHDESALSFLAVSPEIHWLDWQDEKGKIAILTNDEDLAVLCWDLIRQNKEKPACAALINSISASEILQQQLEQIVQKLQSQSIKILLVNLWSTEENNQIVAQTIFDYCQPSLNNTVASIGEERTLIPANGQRSYVNRSNSETLAAKDELKINFIIRLATQNIEAYQQAFNCDRIFWTNNLDEAISQGVSLSKTK